MSVDVGVDDPAADSAPDSADSAPKAVANAQDIVMADSGASRPSETPEAFEASEAPLAVRNAFADGERAVRAYVGSQLSPRSRDNARDALRRLSRLILLDPQGEPSRVPWPAFGFEQITMVRTALFEMTRLGRITPGTANLTLSHWRGLMRTMYGMGLITPAQHELTHSGALRNVPGTRKQRGRALSASEEHALRASARGLTGYQGPMLDSAVVLAIGGGLRREELASLTLDSLRPGMIDVVGKGNQEREVPVDPQMQDALDSWLREREALVPAHEGLFCSPRRPDQRLSPWSFWSLVRAAAHDAFGDLSPCSRKCECTRILTGPHDFRRTLATRALEQDMDIRQLQVLMGHASSDTTARYDKRGTEALFKKRRGMRIIA